MGATAWRYYAAYEPDAEAALQKVRAEVFAKGDYLYSAEPVEEAIRQKTQRLGVPFDSPEDRAFIESIGDVQRAVTSGNFEGLGRKERGLAKRLHDFNRLADLLGGAAPQAMEGPPRSIAELLERAAECGTHSILDIEHTGARRGFGLAIPMSATTAVKTFGTAQPTHDRVEERWPDAAERLGHWQAYYVTVYRNGQPHEYAFIGCSGD